MGKIKKDNNTGILYSGIKWTLTILSYKVKYYYL